MKTFRFMNKKLALLGGDDAKAEVALFDGTNAGPILTALEGFRVLVIPARGEFYYVSFGIIWTTACLFVARIFKRNGESAIGGYSLRKALRQSYFYAVIKQTRCRVVLTYIDNANFYHELSHAAREIPFITFQNGSRYRFGIEHYHCSIRNFFCFGQHEVDLYRRSNILVENFMCFGLLTTLNFLAHNPPPMSEEFDIFYPSQFHDNIHYGTSMPWEKVGQDRVIELLKAILAAKPSITVLIGLRSADQLEKDFYIEALGNNPRVRFAEKTGTYSSYEAARRCRLVLGFTSTLVEEAMSWGQKAMYVHLSPDPGCFFVNPHWQECMVQEGAEGDAITAVQRVLDMPMEDYQKTTLAERGYMMETALPSERIMILQKFLREIVDRSVHAEGLDDVLHHYFTETEKGIWRHQ